MGSRSSAILPRLNPKPPPDPSARHQDSAIAPVIVPASPGGVGIVFRRPGAEIIKRDEAFFATIACRVDCHTDPIPLDPIEGVRDCCDELRQVNFLSAHV